MPPSGSGSFVTADEHHDPKVMTDISLQFFSVAQNTLSAPI
jgi:hypothetical protein